MLSSAQMSLNPLFLALKALDAHQFELLITQLLKSRYPGVDIKHIEGKGGDAGLDIISGDLDARPTIWQCKSFSSGIGKSQRAKIVASFKRALNFMPRRWVLCMSVDMDPKATGWFQDLSRKYQAQKIEITFMGASEIVRQLIYEQTITERFFPQVVLNTSAIREQLARTKEFSVQELADLSDENIQIYLSRLQSYDARFSYELTLGRDKATPSGDRPKGALLSVYRGASVLHVFPRDAEALGDSPVKFHLKLDQAGAAKLMESLKTGAPQHIGSQELRELSSDFDFLLPSNREGMSLTVESVVSRDKVPLRFIFGGEPNAVVYEYLPFKRVQGGTEEATFESVTDFPFCITFVARTNGTGSLSYTYRKGAYKLAVLLKQMRAIEACADVGFVDVYEQETETRLLRARIEGSIGKDFRNYLNVLKLIAEVADAYEVCLTVPDEMSEQDYNGVLILNSLRSGLSLTANEVSREIVKTPGLTLESGIKPDGLNTVQFTWTNTRRSSSYLEPG